MHLKRTLPLQRLLWKREGTKADPINIAERDLLDLETFQHNKIIFAYEEGKVRDHHHTLPLVVPMIYPGTGQREEKHHLQPLHTLRQAWPWKVLHGCIQKVPNSDPEQLKSGKDLDLLDRGCQEEGDQETSGLNSTKSSIS